MLGRVPSQWSYQGYEILSPRRAPGSIWLSFRLVKMNLGGDLLTLPHSSSIAEDHLLNCAPLTVSYLKSYFAAFNDILLFYCYSLAFISD